ncbi:MAG: ribosome maturation factor RimP [Nitrospiraceae bacterium]|nr:ribosome maturation factor RimP [Nitrospiraceae bacterium]
MGNDLNAEIQALLDPILESMGLSLWDLEFKKEGPRWLLRVYIERYAGGVTLNDCETVSRDLGTALDVENIINHAYVLEVSSPGLDRTLSKPEHYQRCIGSMVKIKTYQAIEGQKVLVGTLKGLEGDAVLLETKDGKIITLSRTNIAKASLEVVI